jgi:hypothetical protein
VTFGYGLSRIPARRERRRKAAGYVRGIDAELDYAIRHARIYAEGENGVRVLAPAYRLLTRFHIDGTAWLAGEGFISKAEIEALLASLAAAEEFNRCLDDAAVVAKNAPSADYLARSIAVDRATVKAGNICKGDPGSGVSVTARAGVLAAAARAGLKLSDT